ncbi:MAG: hypothetical protein LBI53_03795 [Candidatus Peribacteria bacterium]|jgi:hypothetical protein|nr:hypothetical protein [Candidatus Peribacteria bacterium]
MRELKKKLKEAGLREIPENETLLETLLSEVLQMVQLSDTQPTTNLCAVGQPLGMRETIL